MSVVLRRMSVADVAACVALLRGEDPTEDEGEWLERFGRDVVDLGRHPVAAVADGRLVGYGRTLPFEPDAAAPGDAAPAGYYLLGLVVAPAHGDTVSGGC